MEGDRGSGFRGRRCKAGGGLSSRQVRGLHVVDNGAAELGAREGPRGLLVQQLEVVRHRLAEDGLLAGEGMWPK